MGVEKGPLALTINYDFAFSSNSVFRLNSSFSLHEIETYRGKNAKLHCTSVCYAFCNNPVFIDNPTKNRKKNIPESGYY